MALDMREAFRLKLLDGGVQRVHYPFRHLRFSASLPSPTALLARPIPKKFSADFPKSPSCYPLDKRDGKDNRFTVLNVFE
jgi:hypothetical protein